VPESGGTVIGVVRATTGQSVTIGASPTASFPIAHPAIPQAVYPLVFVSGAGAQIKPASGMEVFVDDKPADGAVTLDAGQTGRVRVGPVEFVVR
jgi:hypothetical protein